MEHIKNTGRDFFYLSMMILTLDLMVDHVYPVIKSVFIKFFL